VSFGFCCACSLGEKFKLNDKIAYLTVGKLSIYIKDLIRSLTKKNRKTIIPTVTSRLYFLKKFAIIILGFFNLLSENKKMK
jgi:hypothetical protein